jgi:hypothetical protein
MNVNISEDTIAKFVKENLKDSSFTDFTDSDDLKEFVAQIKAGNEIKAAEIYSKARKASIEESRLAATLAKKLMS